MSAQDLFQQGVDAIREERDLVKGRNLLTQALREDPMNDSAWVWLSRTVSDSEKKKQCLERALKINPSNESAHKLMSQLNGADVPAPRRQTGTVTAAVVSQTPSAKKRTTSSFRTVTDVQEIQINQLLEKAKAYLEQEKTESAIEQWVRVLEIEPDHEVALGNAVRYLSRMKYMDDVRELVDNALKSGTRHPSVYLTAIDIARRDEDFDQVNRLRTKLALLPDVPEDIIVENADYFAEKNDVPMAYKILQQAVEKYPKSQKINLRMGKCLEDMNRHSEAIPYFDRAARLGGRTNEGKQAEEKLGQFQAVMTDKERGSTLLAVREAVGIGIFILLLGWLDSKLDFLQMGLNHWLGVILGLIGGYLLVTATSSPQQQPLASWLGGTVPEEEDLGKDEFGNKIVRETTQIPIIPVGVRAALGIVGALVVALAVYLVFSRTIQLLGNPNPPHYYVPTFDEFIAQVGG